MEKNELVVDLILELNESKDLFDAAQVAFDNGYIDHEPLFQDLLLIRTENGDIAVKSKNPVFIFGLIVNLTHKKHGEPLSK